MSFPGYRLLDPLKKPGNIIGSIGRVDDEVNMFRHDDKSEHRKSLFLAGSLDRLYDPAPGAITRQQGKSAIAGKGEFMGLAWNIEMMNPFSDRGIHLIRNSAILDWKIPPLGHLSF